MNKQTAFNPYPQEMLPNGFQYPASYLELSKDTSIIKWDSEYIFPWWFQNHGTGAAETAYKLRNHKIPNSNLIPFARNGEWAAYFNANDISSNPQVIVINLGNPQNIEYFNDFYEWLKTAEENGWR